MRKPGLPPLTSTGTVTSSWGLPRGGHTGSLLAPLPLWVWAPALAGGDGASPHSSVALPDGVDPHPETKCVVD